jgi:hypothetical protein
MSDLSFLTTDLIFTLIFAALVVGFVIFLAISVSRSKKKGTAEEDVPEEAETPEEDTEADPDTDPDDDTDEGWTPPEPEAFPARIVDMRVVTGNVGGNKRPKTGVSFLVTFLTDDGSRTEYPVPEELYVTLDLDQTGTLVLLNGGFFDFGAGDAYDEEAAEAFEETFGQTEK